MRPPGLARQHPGVQSHVEQRTLGVVLLVEPDPAVSAGLAARGWTAVVAGRPEDAIALAAEHRDVVQAVVTDVVTARMSGRALVAGLRRAVPCLRVVFLARSEPGAELVRAEGLATAVLRRPFTVEQLDGTLRVLLSAA